MLARIVIGTIYAFAASVRMWCTGRRGVVSLHVRPPAGDLPPHADPRARSERFSASDYCGRKRFGNFATTV
jgi:hypothetical protein